MNKAFGSSMSPTIRGIGTVAATAATLALALMVPAAAQAEERVCTGTIGAATVDNLRVPQGASCTLNGTQIRGTLKVERNAALVADRIRTVGNVQAEGARRVVVRSSRIGGSFQVVQGRSASLQSTIVNGDILYDSNIAQLAATRNTVGGNIMAFQNRGGVAITANRVDGNLQCKANIPAPTGGRNIVQGVKEDQCARL
jgi:hypothetical protein